MENTEATKLKLSEFYKVVGGDMDEVLDRLEDIEIVLENMFGFEEDPSYSELIHSLHDRNIKDAFRAAHTLKGIGSCFGFARMGDSASVICEKLRVGVLPTKADLAQLTDEYNRVIHALHRLKNGA